MRNRTTREPAGAPTPAPRRRRASAPGARASLGLLALAAALLLPGCAGVYRYRYTPQPVVVQVHTSQGTLDLLLASVLGATRPEGADRDEMHLRFRLQNGTQQPLRLPVGKQKLLSGDLLDFGAPHLIAGSAEAAPGQSVLADLAFPMPEGGTPDVRGLMLAWVLDVEGSELTGTTTFQRIMPEISQAPCGPCGMYGPYGPWCGPFSSPWCGYGWH